MGVSNLYLDLYVLSNNILNLLTIKKKDRTEEGFWGGGYEKCKGMRIYET